MKSFRYILGNGGGYVGLFLGCALVQVPDLLRFVTTGIKNTYERLLNKRHNIETIKVDV